MWIWKEEIVLNVTSKGFNYSTAAKFDHAYDMGPIMSYACVEFVSGVIRVVITSSAIPFAAKHHPLDF